MELEEELEIILASILRIGGIVGEHTLSPHIVLRDHVRSVNKRVESVFHVLESCITLKNLISGSIRLRLLTPGISKRSTDELKRYGSGGFLVTVYATTLLLPVSSIYLGDSVLVLPWVYNVLLARLQCNLIYLPSSYKRKQPSPSHL